VLGCALSKPHNGGYQVFSSEKREGNKTSATSLETFADRIDTLANAVSATAAALAKKDGELVATRRALEARIGDLETYVAKALQELRPAATAATTAKPRRSDTSSASPTAADPAGHSHEEQLQDVLEALGALAGRLDAQQEDVEGRDHDLARRVQDAVASQAAAVERLELQEERIAALEAAPAAPDAGLEQRVEELGETVRKLARKRRAPELDPAVPDDVEHRLAELDRFGIEVRELLDAIIGRVETLGAELDAAAAEPRVDPADLERQFAETGARFDEIVSDLRNLTHILSASVDRDQDELAGGLAGLRDDLASALERIGQLESAPTATSDLPAAWVEQLDAELAAVRAQLRQTTSSEEIASRLDAFRVELAKAQGRIEQTEEIASRTASNTSASTSQLYAVIDELRSRIDQLDQLEDRLAAKLDRAQALWPVALRALEGRIDDIASARSGNGRAADESLLEALEQGVATAHSVIEGAGNAPEPTGGSWKIAGERS
jgi:chromosome segregation ATPase